MKIARPRWRDLKRRDKNVTGGTSVNPWKSLGRKGWNESNRNTRECQPCISLNREYRPCSWNRFYGGRIDGRIVRDISTRLPVDASREGADSCTKYSLIQHRWKALKVFGCVCLFLTRCVLIKKSERDNVIYLFICYYMPIYKTILGNGLSNHSHQEQMIDAYRIKVQGCNLYNLRLKRETKLRNLIVRLIETSVSYTHL